MLVAILLGLSGILHAQGAGHVAGTSHEHANAGQPSMGEMAITLAGYAQLALLVVVLVWPARAALWAGAWSSAALAAVDGLAPSSAMLRIVLVAAEAALVVAFLALVEARARGRPVIGLRAVSAR